MSFYEEYDDCKTFLRNETEGLNVGQTVALGALLKSDDNIYLYGDAGTGKSFLIKRFIDVLDEKTKAKTLILASTGIAAINIGGSTIHRAAQIPIRPIGPDEPARPAETIKAAEIIIVDEISMLRFDAFNYFLTMVKNIEAEQGRKKKIILIGDFLQLPPVMNEKTSKALSELWGGGDVGAGYAFQAPLWAEFNFKPVKLTEVIRQAEKDLAEATTGIKYGRGEFIQWFENNTNPEVIKNAITICASNKQAEQINKKSLKKFCNKIKTFKSTVTGTITESDKKVPDMVELGVGARVISVVNGEGFKNGSVGTVKEIIEDVVKVKFDNNVIADIPQLTWSIVEYIVEKDKDNNKKLVEKEIGTYTQIPLKLAYAITIHKSQGQSYEKVNIYPSSFTAGQLYVALSRGMKKENIHLMTKIEQDFLITSKEALKFYQDLDKKAEKEIAEVETWSIINKNEVNYTKNGQLRKRKAGAGRKSVHRAGSKTMRIPILITDVIKNIVDAYNAEAIDSSDLREIEKIVRKKMNRKEAEKNEH